MENRSRFRMSLSEPILSVISNSRTVTNGNKLLRNSKERSKQGYEIKLQKHYVNLFRTWNKIGDIQRLKNQHFCPKFKKSPKISNFRKILIAFWNIEFVRNPEGKDSI